MKYFACKNVVATHKLFPNPANEALTWLSVVAIWQQGTWRTMWQEELPCVKTGWNWSRINFHHLCCSCRLVRWFKRRTEPCRYGGWNKLRSVVKKGLVCLCGWKAAPGAGTYPCRWCHCPRSLACRYTGVLWWCWCRWRSHRTHFGHSHTRHALWEERITVNMCCEYVRLWCVKDEVVLFTAEKQQTFYSEWKSSRYLAENIKPWQILFWQQSSFWTAMFPNIIFFLPAWLAYNGIGVHVDLWE